MHAPPQSGKKVLLLYPKSPDDSYWSYSKALALLGKRALQPPLGLITVAGMLPDSYSIKLIDLNIEVCTDNDMLWADAVFISAMIAQKKSFAECIAQANRLNIPVVAGGPYPTTSYSEITGVTHFVLGEAELSFPAFLHEWEHGNARHVYARPVDSKEAEKLRSYFLDNADIETVSDRVCVDDSPLPRFDLLDFGAYKTMSIQTSRGCPHGCEFCDIWRRFGRKMRYKSLPKITAELSELYRLGWRDSVFIVDDNFVGNPGKTKSILTAMIDWQQEHGYPFDFSTEASLSLADDPEMLKMLSKARFEMVFLGLETPVEESLKEAGKHVNIAGNMSERVGRIQAAGILVNSGFILGFDSEPENIADRMIGCIDEMGIPVAMVGLLQALPETDLYERLKEEGRLTQASEGNNTHGFDLCFSPKRPPEVLISDYKNVLQALYPSSLKSYFDRCARLRERWSPAYTAKKTIRWFEVKWFFRYLVTSLFTPYFFNSLGFLCVTLIRKPSFLPVAVSLGIQGHHFRQITRLAFKMEELKTSYDKLVQILFDRIRREKRELLEDINRRIKNGSMELRKRMQSSVTTVEQVQQSLLEDALRYKKKISRSGREAARAKYLSLCNEINQAVEEFRNEVAELLGRSGQPNNSRV